MKRFFTVSLLSGALLLGSLASSLAQTSPMNLQPATGMQKSAASEQAVVVPQSAVTALPAMQQIQQQAGIFVSNRAGDEAKPVKNDPTNQAGLEALIVRFKQDQDAAKMALQKSGHLVPKTRVESGNKLAEFKTLRGNHAPLFYVADNLQGAQTISTDKVWPGGLAGLNLNGQGINIGEWDGGAVLTSHQEFGGRVSMLDGSTQLSNHATHVAATIVGAGTDPQAKGMAFQGVLKAYDWNNDEVEMAQAAGAGMLVSNHSYGLISGWYYGNYEGTGDQWYWFGPINSSEDFAYGRYSDQSRDWDLIAQNAPNYLIVKAAGNDRGNGPAAGTTHRAWNNVWTNSTMVREKNGGADGFDCISHAGVAKNVLTVGAVEGILGGYTNPAQVIASSFHGWGPTDDGRIKPDLVAKGVAVYSALATGNADYASWNGTSMASPTVTGSLALLQQRHRQLYGNNVMRAATLKGIAIHTADEAGANPGPDYVYGWGLMNTTKASDVIARKSNQHDFVEAGLSNGSVYTYNVQVDGSMPLRATLSWTDPAAAVSPYVLNGPTSALVNNLDVRIIRVSDSTMFQPWVLNPANPTAAAATGDNNRDNVEQVLLNNPSPGDYIVQVSHKGTLANEQQFSLVVSGIAPQQVMHNITFQVDMTGQTVSPLGVHLAGNFQGWNPAGTPMTNAGNNIWQYTASLAEGTAIEYKFVNGNSWGNDEQVPLACNVNGNRGFVVPNTSLSLPVVLFGQCGSSTPMPVSVTFQVDMTGQVIRPEGVHVAGTFNGWNFSPMVPHQNLPNVYEYSAQIASNSVIEYKFVNGNSWGYLDSATNVWVDFSEQLSTASCAVFGNRTFNVPAANVVIPVVSFGLCPASVSTVLSVDFAGGIPAGWTQQGLSTDASGLLVPDADAVFEYRGPTTTPDNSVGSRGAFANPALTILSPTAANGFVIFDSDFLDNAGTGAFGTGVAPSIHAGALISPALDFSTMTAPVLKFNQFHRRFGTAPGDNTATFIVTSSDGGLTWPDSIRINDVTVLGINIQTLRDDQKEVNLFNLAGQSNVKIQFLFFGDYYFWMLDDISVEQAPANDLALTSALMFNATLGNVTKFGMIPVFQEQATTFQGAVLNKGTNSISQAGLSVNISRNGNNIWTEGATSQSTLSFGATDTINISNPPFIGGQVGEYQVNYGLFNNQGDSNPSNDNLTRHFFITDTVYGLDHGPFGNYVTIGTSNFTTSGSQSLMRFANRYEVVGNGMNATSGFVGLGANSLPGASINMQLYSAADLFTPLLVTPDVTLTAQHITDGGLTIGFGSAGIFLPAGEYYLVAEVTNAGTNAVNVLDDISHPQANAASLIYLPNQGQWFINGIAFVLRLHGAAPTVATSLATLRVNMSKYPVDSTLGVHVAGSFQGWDPMGTPMTHMGNGIYEVVVPIPQGQQVEFKFINGNQWGRDEQNWLLDCGIDNGFGSFNRTFLMPTIDTVLPTYFFNSCGTNLNELSIADIQYVPDYLMYDSLPNRQSRYKGEVVTVKGVVAASMTNSALSANFKNGYLQMSLPQQYNQHYMGGMNTGINVRLTNTTAMADTGLFVQGYYVAITGTVAEFSNTNLASSETQMDIASVGNIQVLSPAGLPVRIDQGFVNDFSVLNNGMPVQSNYGERFEGSYLRFENLEVTNVNQFATGRFDLTLKDGQNNVIRTRDASRVMRAPLFSSTDSTAPIFVQVGDRMNVQGFISEVIVGGVPEYRVNPWYTTDLEVVPFVPGYCQSGAGSVYDTKIDSVILGSNVFSSPSNVCETYTDNTVYGIAANIQQGVPFPISIKVGTCGGFYSAKGRVFIDLNQDFDFTPDEAMFDFDMVSSANGLLFSGNILVPTTALLGNTRMRIVYKEGAATFGDVSPCGTYDWGETEDYTVQIVMPSGGGGMFTDEVRSRSSTAAVVAGTHNLSGFLSKGVAYGANPSPSIQGSVVADNSFGSSIYAALGNLIPATQYYARVYVTDSLGNTTYGNEITFRTFDGLGAGPVRLNFAITAPASAAGAYAFGLGEGVANFWNYEIDTIAVQAPLVVGRAVSSDSLGCDGTLLNTSEMRGKIVVLYRGTCEFGIKALSAQQAGAVGVIIINNQPGVINMNGGVNGANVSIPVAMISDVDGANLRMHIDNGSARAFIGNKFGNYSIDLGINAGDVIKPMAFAIPSALVSQPGDYVVDLGADVANLGLASTNFNLNIQVWRNGNAQDVVYFANAAGQNIGSGQSQLVLTMPFDASVLGVGNHRIRYEVTPTGMMDQGPGDNLYFQDFRITQDVYSAASLNQSGGLNLFGGGTRTAVQGPYMVGNWFTAPTAGRVKVTDLKFSFTAIAPVVLTNQFFEGAIYRWDDLNQNNILDIGEMVQVGTGDYLYPDNGINQERSMQMLDYTTNQPGVSLVGGARYLFAVGYTGFDFEVYAITDPLSNYTANFNLNGMPVSAVFDGNGNWAQNGFGAQTVFSIAAVMAPSSNACQANLSALGNTNICLDQIVPLEVTSTDPIDYIDWYVNGVYIPQVNGNFLEARSDGEYLAVVHFMGGCVDTTQSVNVVVTMPHQAFVSTNDPLHYAAGQAINTTFSAVPQQLLTMNLQSTPIRDLAYRSVLPVNGWTNVPQGTAANFSGEMVIARDGSTADSLACGPIVNTSSLQGKIALVFRGTCSISDKAYNAQQAGAIAVIVANSIPNQFIPQFSASPLNGDSITIPVLIVSNEMGLELAKVLNQTTGASFTYAPASATAYNYNWVMNDQFIAGANGTSYTATMPGDYQLHVESAGGSCAYMSGYWPVSQSNFSQTPWVLQNLGQSLPNQTIRNIEPVSSTAAWALANKTTNTSMVENFYRTTNGGSSWSTGSIPNTMHLGTSHIMALDDQTAFVTLFGDSVAQGLYKTMDGGSSWTRLNVFNNGGFPNFAHFWDQNVGVVIGDPNQMTGAWDVYRTTNGGISWQQVSNIPMPLNFEEYGTTGAVSVAPSGQIYWPTVGGRLFKSSNQGASWIVTNLPAGPGQYNIAFGANGQGAAFHVPSAKLYLSYDDGFSWMQVGRPYGGLGIISSMSFLPNANSTILMASGPQGTAYLENGFNWANIDGQFHGAVKFIEPNIGWSGGLSASNGQGGVWKWDSNIFGGNQPTGTVSGQVRYANNAQTPMSNTWVIAYDAVDHTMRDAVQTDANGQYFFNGAPQGNYILRASTTKPWGGVNATDALRIARHFTSLQPLTGIRLQAADVNANAVINSTDALQVAQRFTGLLNNPNYLRIYFDALLGGNLAGVSSVHMHSGASIDPDFSWQYVVGNWGNPTSPGQLTSAGNGKWSIAMNPINYYNQAPNGPMPAGSSIDNIGMVFRESGPCGTSTPCLEQKDGQNNDIFLYPWLNPPVSSYLGVKAALSSATGFAAGDWIFSEVPVQVMANQNTTADLQAICVGDVDGSYNPGNVRIAPSVNLVNDGELIASTGKLVKLPIKIETGTHLGAMSLVLNYNPAQMQPVALKLADAQRQGQAQVNIAEGNISMAWYDLSGWVVTNEQVIMELEAYVFTEDVNNLELTIGTGSEFADETATPLNNTKLLMPGIRSDGAVANVLSLRNYPNPFRHETTIAFDLPEAGRVKLVVNDMTGRAIVDMDLGELAAGKHDRLFEGTALSAGVYFCELHVQGDARQEKAVIRMIIK